MITFNDIYEAAKKERYSEQLQAIPKNFVSEVAVYLKEKKDIAAKNDDEFCDIILKTKKQLENAMTLFNELMVRRKKKILNLVLVAAETGISKQDFENMFSFEKELFEDLMKCSDASDKKMKQLFNGKKDEEQKNILVVFLDSVGEFLNVDGGMLGPYERGQIVNLPRDVAKILIDDKKCEVVEK